MAADGDGHISTIGADGVVINAAWVSGLNAPKGMAASGGKLYTADLTELVEIDIARATVVNRYPAPGAMMLNDVAAAPDGRIFVSDTFGNSVWVLDGGEMSIFAQDPGLMGVNGLTVIGGALIAASLGDASEGFEKIKPGWVVSLDLATKAVTPYGSAEPSGVLDGVEPDGKGGVIFTDYMGGRLMQQAPGGSAAEIAKLELSAADLEFVPQQGLILVPLTGVNTVVALKWSD